MFRHHHFVPLCWSFTYFSSWRSGYMTGLSYLSRRNFLFLFLGPFIESQNPTIVELKELYYTSFVDLKICYLPLNGFPFHYLMLYITCSYLLVQFYSSLDFLSWIKITFGSTLSKFVSFNCFRMADLTFLKWDELSVLSSRSSIYMLC